MELPRKLRAQCPFCGWKQMTTARRVRCIRCTRGYALFPKRKLSRVAVG